MGIAMQMKISDLCDKWTILRMKVRFDSALEPEEKAYGREVELFMRETNQLWPFLSALLTLAESNARVWENEAAVRKEYKGDLASLQTLTLEEIGRRSCLIRDYNALRIGAKIEIDKIEGKIPERKFDHASGQ